MSRRKRALNFGPGAAFMGGIGGPGINLGAGVADLVGLFANGEEGFLFDNMSDLTRLFTTSSGSIPVAANDDPVGLMLGRSKWGGKTLAQVLAAQPELIVNGDMASMTGWTDASSAPATFVVSGGQGVVTGDGTNRGRARQSITTVVGRTYLLVADISVSGVDISIGSQAGGVEVFGVAASVGAFSRYFVAVSTTSFLQIGRVTAGSGNFDNVSIKEVPGNHASISGGTLRPLYKANSGKPYILPDGVDDELDTPFIPTAALTMAVAVRFPATNGVTSHIAMGGGVSTGNKRAFIGKNVTSGTVAVGWGSETLTGPAMGTDLAVADHTIVVTGDAITRDVWVDGVLVDSRAPIGGLGPDGTGGGFALGGYKNGTGLSTPSQCRIYAALAMNRRATPAEIGRIHSQFQQRF